MTTTKQSFELISTADASGAIYAAPMVISRHDTMEEAIAALKAAGIKGVRGPGCLSIGDDDGNVWHTDPRGRVGEFLGLVRFDALGEITAEWRA